MNEKQFNRTLPASRIIEQLREYPVRVLWSESYYAEADSNFAAFYSFCKSGSKYISLHGEMKVESFHQRRKTQAKVAHLIRSEYELADRGLRRTDRRLIGLGADPRMVSDGESVFAYVIGYGEAKHPAFLYDGRDDALHPIQAGRALRASEDFAWGKNWQPFLKQGRLFIVHELTPLRIYEINLESYELTEVHRGKSDPGLHAHYTNYTMLRGGANALVEDDWLYGIGRASTRPYKHYPFVWSSYRDEAPVFQLNDFFCGLARKGFSIQDPTSVFKDGDNTMIGLSCSETCWFFAQRFLNLLLVVDVAGEYKHLPALSEYLEQFADQYESDGRPRLAQHIFQCDHLQHDVPHRFEYGVRSAGVPGVLVYGPYVPIEEAMRLRVELSYLTMHPPGGCPGTFEIMIVREKSIRSEWEDGSKGDPEFIRVAECELRNTDREVAAATLYIDTADYVGCKLEFRVHVHRGVELNAFHIRTQQIAGPLPEDAQRARRFPTLARIRRIRFVGVIRRIANGVRSLVSGLRG